MTVRYTFFELATQKGQIMAAFGELLPRHWMRGCVSTPDGNDFLFEAKKYEHDTAPLISVTITGRGHRESQAMWNERARREAHKAWESYVAARQAATQERQRLYGADGAASEASSKRALAQLAAIEDEKKAKALFASTVASLIPSHTVSQQSRSAISAEDAVSTDSVPSGPTPTESESTPVSTALSSKTSKRTGSKSRSLSGRSTASSMSGTEPAGSTLPDA